MVAINSAFLFSAIYFIALGIAKDSFYVTMLGAFCCGIYSGLVFS